MICRWDQVSIRQYKWSRRCQLAILVLKPHSTRKLSAAGFYWKESSPTLLRYSSSCKSIRMWWLKFFRLITLMIFAESSLAGSGPSLLAMIKHAVALSAWKTKNHSEWSKLIRAMELFWLWVNDENLILGRILMVWLWTIQKEFVSYHSSIVDNTASELWHGSVQSINIQPLKVPVNYSQWVGCEYFCFNSLNSRFCLYFNV